MATNTQDTDLLGDDIVDFISMYEQGELDEEQTERLFHQLVADGTIYHLQGSYQRTARIMGILRD